MMQLAFQAGLAFFVPAPVQIRRQLWTVLMYPICYHRVQVHMQFPACGADSAHNGGVAFGTGDQGVNMHALPSRRTLISLH